MPAAVPRQKEDSHRADEQQGKHRSIGGHETRIRQDQREQKEGWREDQRLRVSNLGMTCEDIRIPPGPFPTMDRVRQELQLRIEVGLGVPGNGNLSRKPGIAKHQKNGGQKGKVRPCARRTRLCRGMTTHRGLGWVEG
jgi:hypothetical protein